MTAAPRPPRMTKFAALEGLRGVLALAVCLGHYGVNNVLEKFGVYLLKQLAVFVFFALSGFVLSRAYYFGRRPFKRLAVARVARLYPLHIATLLWTTILALVTHMPLDPLGLSMTALLIHNLGLPGESWSLNFPSWSISVEMFLSLAFFFVARRASRPLTIALTLVGLACAALWAATDLEVYRQLWGVMNVGLVCGVGGFSIGVVAYILYVERAEPFKRYARFTTPLLVATLGVMFAPLDWFHWLGAPFAAMTLVLLPLLALTDGTTVLSAKPLVYLGAISYSLYLIHIPVLLTATALLGANGVRGPVMKLMLLAIALPLSALTHRFFEKPAQAFILRHIARSRASDRVQI